jgi:hypothetical protein
VEQTGRSKTSKLTRGPGPKTSKWSGGDPAWWRRRAEQIGGVEDKDDEAGRSRSLAEVGRAAREQG